MPRSPRSDADGHRLVLRGGASAAFGYAIRLGARLAFLFIAGRFFGVALFGAYSLGVAVVELAVAIAGLGMKRYLFKLLDNAPAERPSSHMVLDAALLVTATGFMLATAIIAVVLLLPAQAIAANSRLAILLAAPMIAAQANLDLLLAATRWKHRMRYEVAARSLVEPYVGILAAFLAYLAGLQATGLVLSYWAGTLAALIYAIGSARHCLGPFAIVRYRVVPKALAGIFRQCSLAATSDFINGLLGRIDLYLAGILLGETAAGIYGMARQARTPVRQVRQSLDGMLTPLLARTLAMRGSRQAGEASASAAQFILAMQLPFVLVLAIVGQPLLGWFGPAFAAGYAALILLALAETIYGAFGVSDIILLYERPTLSLLINGSSIAVTIAGTAMLAGSFGLDGIAWAVLVASAVAGIMRRQMLRLAFGISTPLRNAMGPVVATLSVAVVLLLGRSLLAPPAPFALAAVLIVGLAVYAILLKLWLVVSGTTLSLTHLQSK